MTERSNFDRAPSSQRVLAFIKDELAAGREFPSSKAIADHMGWKHATNARDCLHTLAAIYGKLKREWTADGVCFFSVIQDMAVKPREDGDDVARHQPPRTFLDPDSHAPRGSEG